jgi:hypothetical protein
MTFTLEHVEKWDHSGTRVGNRYVPAYLTFVGGPLVPGRSLQLPYEEWIALGKPERVVATITAGEAQG